jgi:hypothetical protein
LPAAPDILAGIANTPVVRLRRCAPANGAELWVKLEYFNYVLLSRCAGVGARRRRGYYASSRPRASFSTSARLRGP